ncbi:MAG: hypothetical protein PWQ67_1924 [Clostridia bacterium]|nr:hypothetical protein [Clostridia bacterium]MDN5323470.1 hypothetical protein [Clostridia bacterium]
MKKLLKDSIISGTVAGIIATVIKAIPNFILWKFGVVKYLYLHIAASAIIFPQEISTPLGITLGIIADLLTGGTFGLLIIITFKLTNNDAWWYKGLIIGSIIWLFALGIAINLGAARIVPVQSIFRITSWIDHLIYGVTASYLITKWSPIKKNQ